MTGLEPQTDSIIEIATIITDKNCNILAEGPSLAIQTPKQVLDEMDEWNTEHHTNSGLVKRIQNSKTSLAKAEQQTLEFLRKWVKKGESPMCGNSICQDRRFMARLMPELEEFFHYRNLDVSALKEMARLWKPEILTGFKKESQHLAMADIRDSINEMVYYQQEFIKI